MRNRRLNPRIKDLDGWQAATREYPTFILYVKWLVVLNNIGAPLTVGDAVLGDAGHQHRPAHNPVQTADQRGQGPTGQGVIFKIKDYRGYSVLYLLPDER